ncbi:MAG: PQQ-dependent dehydrogenase, methanol/ethanol family, partial [Acidobacteriota bacterium]
NAGRLNAAALRAKLTDPNTNPGGRGGVSSIAVRPKSGSATKGVRVAEDAFTLLMRDGSGTLRHFEKRDLAGVDTQAQSLMPAVRAPEAELTNLVAYLSTLRGRDLSKTIRAEIPGGVTYQRLVNAKAEPQNWLSFWGDYQGRHYSALKQVTAANVKNLQQKWAVQMTGTSILESTPIVVDGIMYTSGMPGEVRALDAKTGLQIWRYQRQQKVVNPNQINPFSRGVSILGNRLFLGTLDAALVAMDARTGQVLWETQVADTMLGYGFTSPPLAIDGKIITGIAGGEFGIRGFVDAYDPATGARLWRFNTIPGPGEPGNETWKGNSWQHGGGATWLTGSYDPESDTLYWAVGNPGPDWDWRVREGDDLYTCSVIALDAKTGKLKWHYQFTPSDSHDWDSTEDMILVDREWHGKQRKLLLHADRNGMFYVLDRVTGEFLQGTAFVKQTWNDGFDAKGRPRIRPASMASSTGAEVYPSVVGGTNFQAPSYSPETGWYYAQTLDFAQRYILTPEAFEAGKQYRGGGASGRDGPQIGAIKAIDPETGALKWEFPVSRTSFTAGVLATAGNVVFAATAEGNLIALDAKSGALLWHAQTGASMSAAPISYSVDGKQFVAVSAGNVLYSFGLPE